jgi:hypothetical protein
MGVPLEVCEQCSHFKRSLDICMVRQTMTCTLKECPLRRAHVSVRAAT